MSSYRLSSCFEFVIDSLDRICYSANIRYARTKKSVNKVVFIKEDFL